MSNEEMFENLMGLLNNPLGKNNFLDFFLALQRRGFEAAPGYGSLTGAQNAIPPNPLELYTRMMDFYMVLGLVPRAKYDQALRDNEELRQENKLLKDTLRELQFNIVREGGARIQDTWREITQRQLELNKEVGQNFCELIKQWQLTER